MVFIFKQVIPFFYRNNYDTIYHNHNLEGQNNNNRNKSKMFSMTLTVVKSMYNVVSKTRIYNLLVSFLKSIFFTYLMSLHVFA